MIQEDRCYIYVRGWRASDAFQAAAQTVASAGRRRECVIVAKADRWPPDVPEPEGDGCAIVICGCSGRPSVSLRCGAVEYDIKKSFIDAEAECV